MLGFSGSVSLRLEREARLDMDEAFDHSNKSMQTQRYYYHVSRMNNQHTTLVPGDTFKLHIKVLYHSIHTTPEGLQHRFSPRSIPSHDFFQEGQNFLHSLLSSTRFSIESLEEIAEGVVSTVRELFHVGSVDALLSLESQHRVIPLSVTVIILNYDVDAAREASRQWSRMNNASNEAMIKTFLKKCTVMRGSEDCSICLDRLNIKAECYTMPCHHAFHLPCILTWLKTRPLCPLCRSPLPTLEN
ncbi:unnamed protein product [Sphenostylis stenocarpa]|uniref:RING-type E3 ubiquitin transferase n=1 Tax=Sphenostylis stenocarpa TaxID=92480 RepID=A0AA86SYS2_9FABA|nr:unnamed protein product [Sphenostylis stenocarpa]